MLPDKMQILHFVTSSKGILSVSKQEERILRVRGLISILVCEIWCRLTEFKENSLLKVCSLF